MRKSAYYLPEGSSIDFEVAITEAQGISQSDLQQARKIAEYQANQIAELQDKISRRNMQIKELKQKLNDKYKCYCGKVFQLSEVAHFIND